ncbi:hypothetical protein KUH03_01760 [Sphingobacterium sp. E70]|uniref:hypothetical protein n=1 Tax=Sphingobacterium sp. E70 TaxID=2853439 RepID=UPI00211C0F13|nr:hypothetical protein [Sphingobacterium sp. E70]ULT25750.1 hypothetical protein KUH03_01760 [Sphingobacterium sp. E70]
MTIGTDNKAQNIFTKSGKIKAGAKGIGRFALDKLGDLCEMTTKFNPEIHVDFDENGNLTENIAYKWNVDWRDFEGDGKTIENVEADLNGFSDFDFKEFVRKVCPINEIDDIIEKYQFNSGTVLKISGLREVWLDEFISQLYGDLQVLVPPEEFDNFEIFVFSKSMPRSLVK